MQRDDVSGDPSGPGEHPGAGASPEASPAGVDTLQRRALDGGASAELPTGPAAPRERGWWRLVLGLAAFLLVPATPIRAAVPIEHTLLLVVTAFAACALVGWWMGGRAVLAFAWTGLAAWMVFVVASSGAAAFERMTLGWALLLAAAFGLVCVFGRGRALFGRALAALAMALVIGLLVMAASGSSPAALGELVRAELAGRSEEYLAAVRTRTTSPDWLRFVEANPGAASLVADGETQMRALVATGTRIFPALLALESVIALALAWSLYHRVSRARLGPPLARVKDFRFNDQLVWGLIVGLVIVLLPSLAALRPAGINLLVFFGALYALRGFGVLAWFVSPERAWLVPVIGFAMVTLPFVAAVALGLGLGDTWVDWRTRGAARPTS